MVNVLEMLYAITAVAVLTVIYYLIRGRDSDQARERFTGALWISGILIVTCTLLYWSLS